MKRNAGGFTLIELIVVIVVLGILAATAMPKFIDLKDDAGDAATAGVAGGLGSAAAINYAAKSAGKAVTPTAFSDTAANLCVEATLGSFLTGGWPTGYTAGDGGTDCSATGVVACTVTNTKSARSATASMVCY